MQYHYQIFCPQEQAAPPVKAERKQADLQLFEAYSCLLFESWQALNARVTPLQPLRSGVVLTFDTEMCERDVAHRVHHILCRRNARLRGLTLVARCRGTSRLRGA
jgi:hypothetical protein